MLAIAPIAAAAQDRENAALHAAIAHRDAAAYVRARAADAAGDARIAAQGYAAALAAAPDSDVIAQHAYRQALEIGDHGLAARAAQVLGASETPPPDLPVYRYALAIKANDGAAAQRALVAMETTPFSFMIPVLRAWLAAQTGGDAFAPLDAPADSPLARRFVSEHRGLVEIAGGRIEAGLANVRAQLGGAQGGQDLRIDAALLLATRGYDREARALVRGDGPHYAALRRQLAHGAPDAAAFGTSRLYLGLAGDLAREDTIPLSIVLTRAALLLDPSDDRARLYLADAVSRAGAPDIALDVLDDVVADGAYRRDARIVRTSVLTRADRTEEALASARALAEERGAGSDDAQAYGDLLAANARYDAAADAYALAMARPDGADSWLLHTRRGDALERAARWSEARIELRRGVELGPDQPVALNTLGYALVAHGEDLDTAMELLERARQLRPSDPGITDSLGWAHYKRGDYARAVPLLEEAARSGPADTAINEHLGDAYWQVGRRYEARYAWRAAAVYAENADAERLRTKLRLGLSTATVAD